MKTVHAVLAAVLAFALSACYPPVTTRPVGIPAPETRIAGLWLATPADKDAHPSYFHFLPQQDGSITVLMADAGHKPDGDWSVVTLTTAKLGANTIFNVRMVENDGKPETDIQRGTIPVLYRFDAKGRLSLFLMDEDATKAAIRAGRIAGDPGKGDGGNAILTGGPALDKYLGSREGMALFSKAFASMRRID
ncbi:MAG: hypothetical protein WDM81_10810 [Rhizomicrobium sp.]